MSVTTIESAPTTTVVPVPPTEVPKSSWFHPVVFGSLLTLMAILYMRNVTTYLSPGSDEGVYVSQAWSVLHGSLQPYTFWYDHPPLGWVQLAVFLVLPFKLFPHVQAVLLGRYVMVGYALVDALLVYVIARRLGANKWFSMLAMVGLLSPLALYELRQVYLDGLALPWLLGAFAFALSSKRHIWQYFVSGVLFAIAVLTKETTLLLLPALLYALWVSADKRLRFMSIVVQMTSLSLLIVSYPLFATLRHELLPGAHHVSLYDAVKWQLGARVGSGTAWTIGSDKHNLVMEWVGIDKFILLIGITAAVVALFNRRLRSVSVVLLVMAIPVIKPGGYLPNMYVTVALPFLALSIAGVLSWAWSRNLSGFTWKIKPLMRHFIKWSVMASSLAVVTLLGTTVAPAWSASTIENPVVDQVTPSKSVENYLENNVSRDTVILAEASYFVDLIDAGWKAPWHGVVWYTQLDLDTSSFQELPLGWRSVNYVVVSQQVKRDVMATPLPKLGEAIDHGTVVATFGTGESLVQIIKVGA